MCTEQHCAIGAISLYDANAVANTCTGHLNALTRTRTCDLGCATGYVSSDIEALACAADGNAAVGARSGGITCTEQQCAIGAISLYDANAVANTCTGHLNALTGTRTCDLGCAAGYVSSDIEALACAADENAAVGARSGGIT